MRRRYSAADLLAMIPLYLDGELDSSERSAVEGYLAEHPETALEVARSARLIDALDEAVSSPPVDAAFTTRVMHEVTNLSRPQRWWQRLSLLPGVTAVRWAAEAALLLLLAVLLVVRPWAPEVGPVECRLYGERTWSIESPAGVRVIVRNRSSGQPIPNAPVRLWLFRQRWRVLIYESRTNDQGTVDSGFELPAGLRPGRYGLYAKVRTPYGEAAVGEELNLVRRPEFRLQPVSNGVSAGERLTATVAVLNSDDLPAAVPWRLDSAGCQLARGECRLDSHGVGRLSVPLDSHLAPGLAVLSAELGGRTVSTPLRIYPPTRRELQLSLAIPPYGVLGRSWSGTLAAALPYEALPPGGNAKATLRVGSVTVQDAGQLDPGGHWQFALTVPRVAGQRVGWLTINVADRRGRRATAYRAVPLSSDPLDLALVRLAPQLYAGLENPVAVTAQRPDGQPVAARIDVRLNGRTGCTVKTSSKGETRVLLRPRVGVNQVELRSQIGRRTVSRSFLLHAAPAAAGLVVRPEQLEVPEGEPIRLTITSSGAADAVYLDLLAGGQTVATRSLGLAEGRGSLVLRPPAGVRGEIVVRAYAAGSAAGWRTGWTQLRIVPRATLTAALEPRPGGSGAVELTLRKEHSELAAGVVQVALARETLPAGAAAPRWQSAATVPITLEVDSYQVARQAALRRQRDFFSHSPLVGGILGGLVLLCIVLWVYQVYSDPYEQVTRAERQAWGRVPAVHRRHPWAGVGVLTMGVLLSGLVALGILLAGRQARDLATAPEPGVVERAPGAEPYRHAADGLQNALRATAWETPLDPPLHDADGRWETAGRDGIITVLPPSAGTWQVAAQPLAPGAEVVRAETAGLGKLSLAAGPSWLNLSVGDEVELPVSVLNPTPQHSAVVLTAAVDGGLELADAPTRRVAAAPLAASHLGFRIRAAETGPASLQLSGLAGAAGEPVGQQAWVTPPTSRFSAARAGLCADGNTTVDLELPPNAVAGQLEVFLDPVPTRAWDTALQTVLQQPAATGGEVLAQAAAAALRYRLRTEADRRDSPAEERLREDLQTTYQRVLGYEVRHGSQPTGAFSQTRGGPADAVLTAGVARWLDELRPWPIADPAVATRTRAWLTRQAAELARRLADAGHGDVLSNGAAATRYAVIAGAAGSRISPPTDLALLAALEGPTALLAVAQSWPKSAVAAREAAARRLSELAEPREAGVRWNSLQPATPDGATGSGAALELTAAAAELLATTEQRDLVRTAEQAVAWLWSQARPDGTWGSAALTVAVVKALRAVGGRPTADTGSVDILLDGRRLSRVVTTPEREPFHLQERLEPGAHQVVVRLRGGGEPAFRVVWRYSGSRASYRGPLAVSAGVDRTTVKPGEAVALTVSLTNLEATAIAAASVELPIPAGFTASAEGETSTRDGRLRLAVGRLDAHQTKRVEIALRALAQSAEVSAGELRAQASLDPSATAYTMLPRLKIAS